MARNRRSERKDRKTVEEVAPAVQNGTDPEPQAPKLNGRASLRLQKVLLQRNLATEAQIEHALASEPPAGTDFGDVLVSLGILDEHDLISARAELYGMDVADLRQTTPEHQALDLIPDSMAREHFVIPMALDEVGLHVAMADQPSHGAHVSPGRDERDGHPPDAGAPLRDPPRHREQLPGDRRPRPSRPGLRGRRGHPETAVRDHDGRTRRGRRGRAGGAGRRPHPDPGHA